MRGQPLCKKHAAVVAREAARGADWWVAHFTPTPDEPWRADPEWQATYRDMIIEHPDDDAESQYVRRIRAIFRHHEIEAAWRQRPEKP